MEKKNVLFVIPSLSAGGGEKSLINLLSQIDFSSYNVDLCMFKMNGIFVNSIPSNVNVLSLADDYEVFFNRFTKSMITFLKRQQFNLFFCRIMFTILNRMIKNNSVSEQYTWKYVSRAIKSLDKEYDVAIGYLEKSSIYFVVDKVIAKKKIGWIHTNYSDSGMDKNFDAPYFDQLNFIVTVSEQCAKSLNENIDGLKNKTKVIYNIVSPKVINRLAENRVIDFRFDKGFTHICTIGRLSEEKGIDLAINACKLLVNKGYRIKWIVLGEGDSRIKLQKLIDGNGLCAHFKLLGNKENPYPYLKQSDIYVQPSRYEGKSIALDEAKILGKPIVVTNFETAKDQIQNEMTGLIVDMNEEGLTLGIEKIINSHGLKETFVSNLNMQNLGTEEEVNKLYHLINE
ncbi:glycosyltransferase [Bacillus sp. 1P10SD]|uniref:glycosyltransferase n=1 Tax=Bacillus sp. 1P10SD TaxID=3132265 RepID=UPI0039A4805A